FAKILLIIDPICYPVQLTTSVGIRARNLKKDVRIETFGRSEDEELGNPFFEGDCSSSNEWGDHGVAGDDYEGAPVFDDGYEEAPIFDDDQFEEESMPVYDTD
ncbi:hypothetical protein Tco_0086182, partial [Tanacetum coccineum]